MIKNKEKIIISIYSFIIGLLFGIASMFVYYTEFREAKTGILVTYSGEEIKWDISEIPRKVSGKITQKYIARDENNDIVLLIKSPPIEVWVGEWK